MTKTPWALILGASSGFGEACAVELAKTGLNILGVHMDRRDRLPHVEEVKQRIRDIGREVLFYNINAADDDRRLQTVEAIQQHLTLDPAQHGTIRVLLHSLAFGALRPFTGAEQILLKKQVELTVDVMGNSLIWWVQDLLRAGLFEKHARIFAMTSAGGQRAIPSYGAISAAKAVLEAHIRQLALELAPAGITANAILAGVTDTQALRQIPGHEKLMEFSRQRNPNHRLTRPEDVARTIAVLSHPGTYWMTGNVIHVDGGENCVG
jgi:NAD(P)-dependent dehydrogenase (short-subunit alcohol dehydrogenase family)